MEAGSDINPGARAQETPRERILRAAARLYATKGYDGTSMRDIAEAAGVTKPLIFYHFESKEKLYGSLLREALTSCRTGGEAILAGAFSATEKLRRILASHVAVIREQPEVFAFAFQVLTGPKSLPLDFDYRAQGRALFEQLLRVVEEGRASGEFRAVDPVAAAVMPLAALGMYVAALLTSEIEALPADLEDSLMDLSLNGIKEPKG